MSNSNPNELDYYRRLRETADETKKQGMSDLETAYGTKKTALENSRVKQRQEAAINNELLMKYLPQLNKANGLAGLGVSETANIDALSRYQTNLGNIEATHQQGMSDLDTWKSGKESEILSAYRSDLAKIDAAERAENNSKVTNATTQISSGIFTTEDDLKNYIIGLGFTEGSEEYSTLLNYGNAVINDKERTAATDEENKKKDEAKVLIEYGVFDTVDDLKKYLTNAGIADTEATNDVYDEILNYGSQFIKKETNEYTFGKDTATYVEPDDSIPGMAEKTNLNTPGSIVKAKTRNGIYTLESQGVADESVQTATGDVGNGTVFMLNNGIYIKQNGIVYALSGTGVNYNTADYTALFNYLNTEPNSTTTPSTTPPAAPSTTPSTTPSKEFSPNANVRMIDFDEGTIEVTEKDGTKRYGYMTEVNASPTSNLYMGAKTQGIGVKFSYKSGVNSKANDYVKWDDGSLYQIVYTS